MLPVRTATAAKKVAAKPKQTVTTKKSTASTIRTNATKKQGQQAKRIQKRVDNPGCFTAGTKIHTKDGYKNIEAIKAGDYVWSENPETKEKALKKVKKIFVREKDSTIRLAINGETIETTDEHPFYVENVGFVAAKDLKAGDEVRLESGEEAHVEGIEKIWLDEPVKVYNFEVEDFHTYYVSGQKVLVHNTCAATTKNVVNRSAVGSKSNYLTGTVWDNIRPTQANVAGTNIPKSFELSVEGSKLWVHPNATKHMVEYATKQLSHGQSMVEQELLSSLHGAVNSIVKNGYEFDKMTKLDNWEIIISAPGRTGSLPVIKHALYKP